MRRSAPARGIADPQAQEEPVELRLGQRERALVLDRVLGGQDEERLRQWTGHALDRHLPLLHRLEQCRLGPGGGPVDLVHQQDVREDRAGHEPERHPGRRGALEDARAGDVARQQVRRPLDPTEAESEGPRERPGEERLADPGHVLDQGVALGQQGDRQEPERLVRVHDGHGHAVAQGAEGPGAVAGRSRLAGPAAGRSVAASARRRSGRPGSSVTRGAPWDGGSPKGTSPARRAFTRRNGRSVAGCGPWPVEKSPCGASPGSRCPRSDASRRRRRPSSSRPGSRQHSSLGDVVIDLHGRGGWIARAAVDRQRRARLARDQPADPPPGRGRPPAARRPAPGRGLPGDLGGPARAVGPQGLARREVRQSLRDLRAERRARRDRLGERPATPARDPSTSTTAARSAVTRSAAATSATARSTMPTSPGSRRPTRVGPAWRTVRDRFPTVDGDDALVEQLLDLHSPRQLMGLQAILERIEGDLRSAPVEAAMRLALLHALLPASRLNGYPGRIANLRISGGRIKPAGRRPVARAQPLAGVRGRLPPRPRLRPASRGCAARAR